MLLSLLRWIDASAWHYWLAAWVSFALCLLAAVWPPSSGGTGRRWQAPPVFGVLLCGMVGLFRWPGLTANTQWLNPDESQMLASALTYRHFGALWGHVDGMSSGPLVSLPLLLPAWFGLPVDYTTARLVGLLLGCSVLVFLWLTLRHVFGDRPARLLTLPPACALAFTAYPEYVQYSSEQAPLAYCALALWLMITAFSPDGKITAPGRLAGSGFVLGLLVVAKLQLVPLGLILGVTGLVWCVQPRAGPPPLRRRALVCLLGGTAVALAGLVVSLAWCGELQDFWLTHILSNFRYAFARDYPWSAFPPVLCLLADQDLAYVAYALPVLLLLVAVLGWSWLEARARRVASLAAALFAGSIYAVAAPGRLFPHYLLIAIPFAALLAGSLYGGLITSSRFGRRTQWAIAASFAAIAIVPQVWVRATTPNLFLGRAYYARGLSKHPVSVLVGNFARPGDTLGIWGWMPRYYVETGLPQATREAHTQREITPNLLRRYLFDRYLADLQKNRPAVFLDVVGPGSFIYQDRRTQGHEIFPELRGFLSAHYTQVVDLESTRVFIRRDRLPVAGVAPEDKISGPAK